MRAARKLHAIAAAGPEPAQSSRRPASALHWFAPVPVAMLLDPALSSDAKVLAGILLHYDGPSGCHPRIERLMLDINASKNKVLRLLEELERHGFLLRERRGRNNRYSLRPVYERPLRPDSLEATGALEILNARRPRPEKRNALHKPRTLQTLPCVPDAPKKVPPVEPIRSDRHGPNGSEGATQVPPTEPIASSDHSPSVKPAAIAPSILERDQGNKRALQSVPSATPNEVPPGEPTSPKRFHPWNLDRTKNQGFIKNQHHQDDPVGGEGSASIDAAIAALQRVRVNLATSDLGIHAGRQRRLRADELADWARWVASGSARGISNKPAFAAATIRKGCTLDDAFPEAKSEALRIRDREKKRADAVEALSRLDGLREERTRNAEQLLGAMKAEERRRLREAALNDAAVWIAKDASSDVFAQILAAAERRLVLGESVPSTVKRDYGSRDLTELMKLET